MLKRGTARPNLTLEYGAVNSFLRLALGCGVLLLPSCSSQTWFADEPPLPAAIVGKWLNVDGGADSITFDADGSFIVAGQRKRDVIRGRYTLLNDRNIEMRFRFADGSDWRPRWMPPGVRKSPVIRCYVRFFGDELELRPRGRIQAENFDQYIEFNWMRFDRVAEEADG